MRRSNGHGQRISIAFSRGCFCSHRVVATIPRVQQGRNQPCGSAGLRTNRGEGDRNEPTCTTNHQSDAGDTHQEPNAPPWLEKRSYRNMPSFQTRWGSGMIAALVAVALLWWGCLIMVRDAHTVLGKPVLGRRRVIRRLPTPSPQYDPTDWPASYDSWTALDEKQLIRLLTESAPDDPSDSKR